jgi:hypothetical protein
MTEQRTPIYLEVDSEIAKVAIAFALGDQRSEARFVANVEVPPSLVVQDRRAGLVAVAWLDGVNLRAGKRLLLGYLVGLVGTPQNLEVLGLSARGLDDDQDVLLDVTAAFETGSALSEIRTILLAPGSSIGMAGSFRWAAPPFSRQTSELVGILRP